MPNVIDAMIVTLGLDASQFKTAAAGVQTDLKKVSESSTATGKEMEAVAKHIVGGLQRVRNEVIGLFAVITAGRGFKQFASDITDGDAAVGRMAKNIGMGTDELSAWEGAAVRAGGTASGMANSIAGLLGKFEEFKLTGQGGDTWIPWLQRMGITLRDTSGHFKSFTTLMLEMSKWSEGKNRQDASFILSQLGLDQGTISTIVQGRGELEKSLARQKELGLVDKADADAAIARNNALNDLRTTFESFGRTVLTAVTPTVVGFIGAMQSWLLKNKEWLATEITTRVEQLGTFLRNIPWNDVITGITSFAKGANDVVQFLGGWVRVSETLFGLWLGSKFLGVLRGIGLMRAALGVPGLLGIAAATTYEALHVDSLNAGEEDELKARPGGMQGVPMPYSEQERRDRADPAGAWWRGHGSDAGVSNIGLRSEAAMDEHSRRNPGFFESIKRWWNGKPVESATTPEVQALLDQVAVGESGGRYDVRYGGLGHGDKTFTDMSQHPNVMEPTTGGKVSSAAGKYQFTKSTWDEMQQARADQGFNRLPDFSPKSQEEAGAFWVQEIYRRHGGDNLTNDLKRGKTDPALMAHIADIMHHEWTSAPGGSEPNAATNHFVPSLMARLNAIPEAPATAVASAPAPAPAPADPSGSEQFAAVMKRLRDIAAVPAMAGTGTAARDPGIVSGAQASAARNINTSSTDNSNTSTSTAHIGQLTVNTQATDPKGVATTIGSYLASANYTQTRRSLS